VDSGRSDGRIKFVTRYDKDAKRVVISIIDNGPGISQQIAGRVFDPFFTTKPVGIGTGLGLSIAHGIITEHGGTIRFENIEGGGAAFTIELPTGAGTLPRSA
jgi:signal transduction histidine kinase